MKTSLIGIAGISLLGALAFGAVKTYVVDPKTVSSAKELLEIFFEARESLPPLPSPVSYEEVMNQLAEGRMDFVAHTTWAYPHDAGTYYLSDKSKLASELTLPIRLIAYEDLLSGTVVLAATSEETKGVQTLAIVKAPEFSPYDEKTSIESYLMWELGPRRMIWTATLKSESDAWVDMIKAEEAVTLSVAPMMMAMSAPEAITELQLGIESLTNSTVEIQLQWPAGFSGTLEIYSATDLVAANWEFAHTNISTFGFSEHFWNDTRTNSTTRFYVAGNADYDEDGDGLASAREKFIYKTMESRFDTDGDGLGDGLEFNLGFNPLVASSAETLGDADNDGYSNLEEQLKGTAPNSPNPNTNTGTVATVRFYYDIDDRLSDCFVGTSATETTYLSESGNIIEEVGVQE